MPHQLHYDLDTPPQSSNGSKVELKLEMRETKSTSQSCQTSEADMEHDAENELPKGLKFVAIIGTLMLCCFLAALELTVVATAVPSITEAFNSLDDVGWYAAASYLTQATFQSTWGKAYGIFDLKWTLISSITIFEIGNLVSGAAPSSTVVIVGRAISGIGGSGVIGGVFIIIAFVTSKRWVPACMSLVGATFACASVIGPLVGGALTSRASWRWVFYFSIPLGGVAILVLLLVFETPKSSIRTRQPLRWPGTLFDMDFVGAALITASVTCFLLAMQWGGATKAWNSPSVIATLVVFAFLLCVFFGNEYLMGNRALAPSRLLKKWTISGNCILTFLISGAYFPLVYFMPIYFQAIQGVDALQSGIRSIPFILGVSIFTILSGSFISKTNSWTLPLVLGTAIVVAGTACIRSLSITSTPGMWIGFEILAGAGIGLALQIPNIANQKQVSLGDIPQVIGTTLFCELLGAAFFTSTSQALFANGLVAKLALLAPGLDGAAIVRHGALGLRESFGRDDVPAVLLAYMAGLQRAFTLPLACAVAAACVGVVVAVGVERQKRRSESGAV